MEQIITTDLLSTIYKMAMQYCVAAFGNEPTEVCLRENGFSAMYDNTRNGEYDIEFYNIPLSDLKKDLEEIYNERKAREAEAERKREIEREKRKQAEAEISKRNRYSQYLTLKKEFE